MSRVRWIAGAAAVFFVCSLATASAAQKKKLEKLDDLPRHTYTVDLKPSEILKSDEAFTALADKVKADVESILDTYEIDDHKTLQGLYATLQQIYFLEGDYDASARYLEMARGLEDKEAQKLMMGRVSYAYVDALKEAKPGTDEFRTTFQSNIAERIKDLPWDTVQDLMQMMSGQMGMLSENLLMGMIQSQMDPAVEKAGYLSGDQAKQLIGLRNALVIIVPYKDQIGAALGNYVAAHKEEKKADIWPDREVSFTGNEGYQPVVVGIWDSGVDVAIFGDAVYTNPKEKMDGKDDDKNGFVDDVHGIAFDVDGKRTTGLLYPLGDYADKAQELESQMKGFTDVSAGIDSDEARQVKERMSQMAPDAVKPFMESMMVYTEYAHGTHVAGIAADGNPYAVILGARLTFDTHIPPKLFTMEMAKAWAAECRQCVDYFKKHDVRVVNMSWGLSTKEIEKNLEDNGVGKDAEDRGKKARAMFEVVRKGLRDAVEGAPDILFCVAAGNSDNDVEFDEFIPSGFDLPNVIVAGAVDQAGEATSFTSFGKTVKVYADGFEVESYVPGGHRLALSGTSMASPNVANLAAKLIARDATLSPEETIRLIRDGADDMGKDKPMFVINPKKSMSLLDERLHSNE